MPAGSPEKYGMRSCANQHEIGATFLPLATVQIADVFDEHTETFNPSSCTNLTAARAYFLAATTTA